MKKVLYISIVLFVMLVSLGPVSQVTAADAVDIAKIENPSVVEPGNIVNFKVTVKVNSGQLLESRGDMLRNTDGNLFGHWPHIAVVGTVNPGQSYTFVSYGSMVAPTAEGNYTSKWRVWQNATYVGQEAIISFEVKKGSGGGLPPQPEIQPRSVWHAAEPAAQTAQTPNHIVIHHSDSDLSEIPSHELKVSVLMALHGVFEKTSFNFRNILANTDYASIAGTWPGLIWLTQKEHMLEKSYDDIGYHYLIDPDNGMIYEGRKGGPEIRGETVELANTSVIAINFLGKYMNNKPTDRAVDIGKKLVDWLVGKYGGNDLQLTGTYVIPHSLNGQQSCQYTEPDKCTVPDIAGHRDLGYKTGKTTDCPGNNLQVNLPFLRGQGTKQTVSSYPAPPQKSGLLFGLLSPAVIGVVDPGGRRLGVNPVTGQFVNEIPGGNFGNFGEERESFYANVSSPINGIYRIDMLGTGSGTYTLAVADLQTANSIAFSGNTAQGRVDQYQLLNNTQNPGQFELFHDNEPPSTTPSLSGTLGSNGWYTTTATVSLSATDLPNPGASGVKRTEYSLNNGTTWQVYTQPFTLRDGTHTLLYRSIDRVDNVETAKGVVVKVDTVPPVVNVSTDKPQYTRVEPFGVHYTCSDPQPGSGIASCTASFNNTAVQNGQTLDLFWLDLGNYAVNARAEDNAGWVTTKSASFKLIATIESQQATVDRLCKENYITKQGICSSLSQKLDAALASRNRGQTNATVNQLQALQSEVNAQSGSQPGKSIKPEAAHLLLMDSDYVIQSLSPSAR